MTCEFIMNRGELLVYLQKLNKVTKSARKRDTVLEVTLTKGGMTLTIPGCSFEIPSHTMGGAKFTIKLWYFIEIVKSYGDISLEFFLSEDKLKLKTTTFNVHSTFFQTDAILRSIDLPLNYNYIDLLKLKYSGKYTEEEIGFNQLTEALNSAKLRVKTDIDDLYTILKKYSFKKDEVSKLVLDKIDKLAKT